MVDYTISHRYALVTKFFIGSLKTTATWMRDFVQSHPEYQHDSVVSQGINFDLIHAVDEIERGSRSESTLLGML